MHNFLDAATLEQNADAQVVLSIVIRIMTQVRPFNSSMTCLSLRYLLKDHCTQ